MASYKTPLKVLAALGLVSVGNNDEFSLLKQAQAIKMSNYQELSNQSKLYLESMTQNLVEKKRHRKKHHRKPIEEQERPSPDENVSVDIYEVKEPDQINAEKATMDMIKEELSKEMGEEGASDVDQQQPIEETNYNPRQEKKLHNQMNKLSNQGETMNEEQEGGVPGNFAAQRIFQQELDSHRQEEDEKKQEEQAAARVHAQMTNTASQLRSDPFGIDVRDNHTSSFDPNSYDVNEQHRQVELLKSSASNLKKPKSLVQPVQSAQTANLIANAISHQMLKSQGLPQEEGDDGSSPGIFGFSKRLTQITKGQEEQQKPVVPNISEEELMEGQKMKPLSLSEQTKKNSVVQRTLDAMKAKHQAMAEEQEIKRLSPYLNSGSPQAAPVVSNPIKPQPPKPKVIHVQQQARKSKAGEDVDDIPELKTKKVNLAEEQQEAVAAMEDVEERQRKAVERSKKQSEEEDDSDDEKDNKKKSTHGSDDEAKDETKQIEEPKSMDLMPKSIAQISKEMAVRKTIQAIKDRKNQLNQAQQPTQPIQPTILQKKKQIENEFVPEQTKDAETFSRDLKNLEQLNTKFHKPLEVEREKELADKKASEEWKRSMDEEQRQKSQRLAQEQEMTIQQIKAEKEKTKDYQIVTTKLDIDDSELVPKQDRISFTQQEKRHEHKKINDYNKEPEVMKQKLKQDPSFSIETSKLDYEDEDISDLVEKKQQAASKKKEKKSAVKKVKKDKKRDKKKEEDPYAFTIETTKMDFPVDDVRDEDKPEVVTQAKKKVQSIAQTHKKAGLQSSSNATSLIKASVNEAQKKKVNDIAAKVKQRQLVKRITDKAKSNQKQHQFLASVSHKGGFPGGEVSIAEKLASIATVKKSEKSVGDPYDIFSQALSNTFKTDGDNANKIQDVLEAGTLSKPQSSQSIIPNLNSLLSSKAAIKVQPQQGIVQMPDMKKKVLTYEEYERAKELKKDAFKEKVPELPKEDHVKIENHAKKANKNLQDMINQIFQPVQPALANLGHQNNATISIVINDEKIDANMLQALIQKQKKHRHKKKVKVGQLMDEIKGSMIVDKDELRKREIQNDIMRTQHIAQVHNSESNQNSNAITDDYLKAVEASIDTQQNEEQMIHQNAVQKTLAIAKEKADKERKQQEQAMRKAEAAAEKAHQDQMEQLKKEQDEHDAKVRMEKEIAKEKHDDIVQKAIEQGKAMQPILEQQKQDELAQKAEEQKEKAEQQAEQKKKEESELNDFIHSKGSNSEIHSITQKLSSFTDMANSLKSTIDDVDAMKNVNSNASQSLGSLSSESKTADATDELKSQAKLNSKKAEELAAQIVGKDPDNALKILEQQEKDDAKNEIKMTPLKSKKDEVVAKALYTAKENMKKSNHPLTGFLMGGESSSYAVQLNENQSANEELSNNDIGDLQKHNRTVAGAIVHFSKTTHLLEHKKEEKKEQKHEEKKCNSEKNKDCGKGEKFDKPPGVVKKDDKKKSGDEKKEGPKLSVQCKKKSTVETKVKESISKASDSKNKKETSSEKKVDDKKAGKK